MSLLTIGILLAVSLQKLCFGLIEEILHDDLADVAGFTTPETFEKSKNNVAVTIEISNQTIVFGSMVEKHIETEKPLMLPSTTEDHTSNEENMSISNSDNTINSEKGKYSSASIQNTYSTIIFDTNGSAPKNVTEVQYSADSISFSVMTTIINDENYTGSGNEQIGIHIQNVMASSIPESTSTESLISSVPDLRETLSDDTKMTHKGTTKNALPLITEILGVHEEMTISSNEQTANSSAPSSSDNWLIQDTSLSQGITNNSDTISTSPTLYNNNITDFVDAHLASNNSFTHDSVSEQSEHHTHCNVSQDCAHDEICVILNNDPGYCECNLNFIRDNATGKCHFSSKNDTQDSNLIDHVTPNSNMVPSAIFTDGTSNSTETDYKGNHTSLYVEMATNHNNDHSNNFSATENNFQEIPTNSTPFIYQETTASISIQNEEYTSYYSTPNTMQEKLTDPPTDKSLHNNNFTSRIGNEQQTTANLESITEYIQTHSITTYKDTQKQDSQVNTRPYSVEESITSTVSSKPDNRKIVSTSSTTLHLNGSTNSLPMVETQPQRFKLRQWRNLTKSQKTKFVIGVRFTSTINIVEWFHSYDKNFRNSIANFLVEEHNNEQQSKISTAAVRVVYVAPTPMTDGKLLSVCFMVEKSTEPLQYVDTRDVVKLIRTKRKKLEKQLTMKMSAVSPICKPEEWENEKSNSSWKPVDVVVFVSVPLIALIVLLLFLGWRRCKNRSQSFKPHIPLNKWKGAQHYSTGRHLSTDLQCISDELDARVNGDKNTGESTSAHCQEHLCTGDSTEGQEKLPDKFGHQSGLNNVAVDVLVEDTQL